MKPRRIFTLLLHLFTLVGIAITGYADKELIETIGWFIIAVPVLIHIGGYWYNYFKQTSTKRAALPLPDSENFYGWKQTKNGDYFLGPYSVGLRKHPDKEHTYIYAGLKDRFFFGANDLESAQEVATRRFKKELQELCKEL